MNKLKPLVVPEEIAGWFKNMKLGDSENFFNMIRVLGSFYRDMEYTPLGYFIIENKKELIEVIIGSREYKVEEEPLYGALIKGHELSSNDLKYWHCEAYNLGRVFVGAKHPYTRCINRMTKKNWNKLGINDLNADFVKVEEPE